MRLLPPNWCRSYDTSRERRAEAARRKQRAKAFYSQFVRRGDLCFDVGANTGNRTDVLLDIGARIVCIEPQPSCVKTLRRAFGRNPQVIIVAKALGERDGGGNLFVCDTEPTISTMSDKWRKDGRFATAHKWTNAFPVEVTTLDRLIECYGTPAFCKIDVEGSEITVLKGLTKPIPTISFEFTREFFSDAQSCIAHLLSLGPAVFNASLGESMSLLAKDWVKPAELYGMIEANNDSLLWGDIYARFT